jgi:small subunit ribosomal protein S36
VLAATALFGGLTAAWSVLTPLTEAPDEPAHLGLVLHVAETGDHPAYDELQHTRGLFQLCVDHAASASWCRTADERAAGVVIRDHPAAAAPARADRARWDDPAFRRREPGRMNQMPQHPPLYYGLMATGLEAWRRVAPDATVDTELAFLRLLNVVLVLPLPWLAWTTARRLGVADQAGAAAALVPLAVPQLTHIGATLNNDNLFVLLASALTALLAGAARGDRSVRTAVLVGLTLGLALLTKGFGVVLPPVVGLAYWVGTGSGDPRTTWRRRARAAAPPAGGSLALAVALSGWWYIGNLVTAGRLMPSIEDSGRLHPETRPAGFAPHAGEYLGSTLGRLVGGFWGDFGWRRVHLPLPVSVVATVVVVVVAVLALRGESTSRRASFAVLLAPLTLLAGFVVVRSAVIYAETGRLAFQQGRYLFGGLTAAAVVVGAGLHERLAGRAVGVVAVAATLMQATAVACCLDGWWSASDVGPRAALQATIAWGGWPAPVAAALLVLPLVVVALTTAGRSLPHLAGQSPT